MNWVRTRLLALVAGLVLLATGCQVGEDDEMAPPPRRTVTVTPSAQPAPQPDRIPVGTGDVDPTDVVWVQGSLLHVGKDAWDLAPRRVSSFVVVDGGVYFLDGGTLWFTDLSRVRDTGVTGGQDLAAAYDGRAIRVGVAPTDGRTVRHGYETTTGRQVPSRQATPATQEQLLGTPSQVTLRPDRSDLGSQGEVPARLGPGIYGLVDQANGPLVGFVERTSQRVPLRGVVGDGFELVRWTSPARFYGLALEGDQPRAVIGCDLDAGSCTTYGSVDDGGSLLFASGS
jgi:hypothetical protein